MKGKYAMAGIAILVLAGLVAAQPTGAQSAKTVICTALSAIRWLLFMIAAGVAIVVVTLQGVKWVGSAEDPGARKQAKQGIIHAFVGLVIVLAAIWIVTMVFTAGCGTSWTNPT